MIRKCEYWLSQRQRQLNQSQLGNDWMKKETENIVKCGIKDCE